MTNQPTMMERLAAPFELWQHDYRENTKGWGDSKEVTGYITYVGVEHAIARLNEVLGNRWSWEIIDTQFVTTLGFKGKKDPEAPQVSGVLTRGRISWTDGDGVVRIREGQGAAQFTSGADDMDKVVKSAQAEAFKKASHVLGVGAYLWDRGLADYIALELLRAAGRPWEARIKPRKPENPDFARRILGVIRDGAHDAVQPPASDPPPPRDARDVANKRLRAIAGKIGKERGLTGEGIAAGLKVLMDGRSSKDLTPDELENLARMLEDDPGALMRAVPADPAEDPTVEGLPADLVVFRDGRAVNSATGEVLAEATVEAAQQHPDVAAMKGANTALMDALKAAFPGAKLPEIKGHATNIGRGRFRVESTDQITAAGRQFLADEIKAGRFDTIKLAQAELQPA